MSVQTIIIRLAIVSDFCFIDQIVKEIESTSLNTEAGICKRSPEFVSQKINEGNAVIAVSNTGDWVGFCSLESHEDNKYVSSCALIISPSFRRCGIAHRLKREIGFLAKKKYPNAILFGLTTSETVIRINKQLNYHEVPYNNITMAESFWQSCSTCKHYPVLLKNAKTNCLCTAMIHVSEPKKKDRLFRVTRRS